MNENPELDLETQRLIDAVCEGVEVPSDEEVEATQQVQNWRMDDLADFNQMEDFLEREWPAICE
jgi:hypothetical protein